MIGSLQRFVETLRARGVSLSAAEVLDAARAAEAVGPDHRDRFRAALAMTLAKDRRALAIFEESFESFFAAPVSRSGGAGRGERGGVPGASGAGGGSGSGAGDRTPPRREDEDDDPRAARQPVRREPRWRCPRPPSGRSSRRARPGKTSDGGGTPCRRPIARASHAPRKGGRRRRRRSAAKRRRRPGRGSPGCSPPRPIGRRTTPRIPAAET